MDASRTLFRSADLWVWDESMNFIDIDTRAQIESTLLIAQPTLSFVEPDRRFVESIATGIV